MGDQLLGPAAKTHGGVVHPDFRSALGKLSGATTDGGADAQGGASANRGRRTQRTPSRSSSVLGSSGCSRLAVQLLRGLRTAACGQLNSLQQRRVGE